ncbi:MAG: leucine-rich repeat domain-containing protein, partial [Ruminococcus sp.]|nr:leucine-rich repeat domain-containing protein [Ruminococcus sp.]
MKTKTTSIITAIIMVISMLVALPMGALADATDYIDYKVLDDGTIEITKFYSNDEYYDNMDYVVPSEIDGKAVTVIGENAFDGAGFLNTVVIPEGVTEIKANAFKNCGVLRSVTIPSTVKHIGDSAFYGCTILTKIEIPYGVETIGNEAFYDTSLSSISLPGSITSISNAFDQCWSLSSITYGDGFTKITSDLFPGYPANAAITKITIGKDVDEIEFPSSLP